MGLGTWAMLGFGIAVSRRFRLSRATHDVLMGEIEHLRGGGREPTSPHARDVVQDEELFGDGRRVSHGPTFIVNIVARAL